MAFPVVPLLLGGGTAFALFLATRKGGDSGGGDPTSLTPTGVSHAGNQGQLPPPPAGKAVVTAPSGILLRAEPNENSSILSYELVRGSLVTVLQTDLPPTPKAPKGWAKIQTSSGKTGFGTQEYLAMGSGISGFGGMFINTPHTGGIGALSRMFLRCRQPTGCYLQATPWPNAPALATVPKGAVVQAQEQVNDWVRVSYAGRIGWAPRRFFS